MKRYLYSLLICLLALPVFAFTTTKEPMFNGVHATVDLPKDQHIRNVGGSDGGGLCVGTSVQVAGRWQNVTELEGFQDWLHKRPGGSWPERLTQDLPRYAKSVVWLQHTGGDTTLLELSLRTRRAPCITYAGVDGFYPGPIPHMVNGAHLDAKVGAIIDNNRPGFWVWMERIQLLNRWNGVDDRGRPLTIRGMEVGGGWLVVLLSPPPPPVPGGSGVPRNHVESPEEPVLFGVTNDRLSPNKDRRYWIGEQEVTRDVAFSALTAGPGLTDDSNKYHLSVCASNVAEVYEMWLTQSQFALYRDRVHFQVFNDKSWVARDRLKSVITLQEPAAKGGRVLLESDEASAAGILKVLTLLDSPKPEPKPEPLVIPVPVPFPMPMPCPDPPDVKPAPVKEPVVEDTPPAPAPPFPWILVLLCGAAASVWLINRRN